MTQETMRGQLRALGVSPGGFRMKDGTYEDIIPHYHIL